MNEEIMLRASEIVNKFADLKEHCGLSLIDIDGFPTSSTITVSKSNGIVSMTFCTGFGTKSERIKKCNHASVCFNSEDYNITLKGTIEILTDNAIKSEMWYDGLQNHFSGPDDPNFCVLRFNTMSYNLLVDWKEARGVI